MKNNLIICLLAFCGFFHAPEATSRAISGHVFATLNMPDPNFNYLPALKMKILEEHMTRHPDDNPDDLIVKVTQDGKTINSLSGATQNVSLYHVVNEIDVTDKARTRLQKIIDESPSPYTFVDAEVPDCNPCNFAALQVSQNVSGGLYELCFGCFDSQKITEITGQMTQRDTFPTDVFTHRFKMSYTRERERAFPYKFHIRKHSAYLTPESDAELLLRCTKLGEYLIQEDLANEGQMNDELAQEISGRQINFHLDGLGITFGEFSIRLNNAPDDPLFTTKDNFIKNYMKLDGMTSNTSLSVEYDKELVLTVNFSNRTPTGVLALLKAIKNLKLAFVE